MNENQKDKYSNSFKSQYRAKTETSDKIQDNV